MMLGRAGPAILFATRTYGLPPARFTLVNGRQTEGGTVRVELLGLLCVLALSGCQIASSTHKELGEPQVRPALPQVALSKPPPPAAATPSDPADAPALEAPVFENTKGENRMLPTMKALPIVDLDPIGDALLRSKQVTAATVPVSPAPAPAPTVGLY